MSGDAAYMRAYRVLAGKQKTITVDATVLGRLWEHGGETTRAILSTAFDTQLLDACHTVATDGPRTPRGRGKPHLYGNRPGRPQQRDPLDVDPEIVFRLADGAPIHREATTTERQQAARLLRKRGHPLGFIARRLDLSESYVSRLAKKDS